MEEFSSCIEKKPKKSVVVGDSDDDGEANAYDYNDSFIDDEDVEGLYAINGDDI